VKDLENQHQDERLEEWERVSRPIEQWIQSQEQTLQSLQESPEDLNSLFQQQEAIEVRVCNYEDFHHPTWYFFLMFLLKRYNSMLFRLWRLKFQPTKLKSMTCFH
jgi:hypothetical protein